MKKLMSVAMAFALVFGLCLAFGSFAEAASVTVQGMVRAGFSGLGHFSGSYPDGSSYEGDNLLEVRIKQCYPGDTGSTICVDQAPILSSVDGFTYGKNLVFSNTGPVQSRTLGSVEVKVNLVQNVTAYYPGGITSYSTSTMALGEMKHVWITDGDTLIMDHKRILPRSRGLSSPPKP